MSLFTARFTVNFEQLVNDQWGLTGKVITYITESAKLVNASVYNDQICTFESNLSAQAMTWAPLGASAPGSLMLFQADQPCDIRTNGPSDTTFLSGVQLMVFAGHVSNIWVTTGSYPATTIRLIAAGGSNADLTTTLPTP